MEIIQNYTEHQKRELCPTPVNTNTEQISLIKTSKKEEKLFIAFGMAGRAHPSLRRRSETHTFSRQLALQTRRADKASGIDSRENLRGLARKECIFHFINALAYQSRYEFPQKYIIVEKSDFHGAKTHTHKGQKKKNAAARWDAVIVFARRQATHTHTPLEAKKQTNHLSTKQQTRGRQAPGAWKKWN